MEDRDGMVREACGAYRTMIRGLLQSASEPGWVELDLTIAQVKVLVALSEGESAAIGRLADRLGVGQPTASHLVERLVRAGLAGRAEDPEDRRRTLTRLTPLGEELVDRLLGGVHQLPDLLRELDDEDLAALLKGLRAAARAAQRRAEKGEE